MTKKILLIILTALLLILTGCESTPKPPKVRGDDWIADLGPFNMDYIRCQEGGSFGKISPVDLVMYLYPRSNTLEIRWKSGMNYICWDLSKKDRDAITECAQKYLAAYNEKNLPEQKPSKKTAWWSGILPIAWGVGGFTYTTKANSYITYNYAEEGKPYFMIHSDPTRAPDEENVSSPKVSIYMSPAQVEKLIELISQENLNAEVDAILDEVYEW